MPEGYHEQHESRDTCDQEHHAQPTTPMDAVPTNRTAAGWTKTWYCRVLSEHFRQSDQKNYLLWYILFKNTCAYSAYVVMSIMIDWVCDIDTYCSDKISEHCAILENQYTILSQWVRIIKLWIFHLSYRWVKVMIISLLTYTFLKMIFLHQILCTGVCRIRQKYRPDCTLVVGTFNLMLSCIQWWKYSAFCYLRSLKAM